MISLIYCTSLIFQIQTCLSKLAFTVDPHNELDNCKRDRILEKVMMPQLMHKCFLNDFGDEELVYEIYKRNEEVEMGFEQDQKLRDLEAAILKLTG